MELRDLPRAMPTFRMTAAAIQTAASHGRNIQLIVWFFELAEPKIGTWHEYECEFSGRFQNCALVLQTFALLCSWRHTLRNSGWRQLECVAAIKNQCSKG